MFKLQLFTLKNNKKPPKQTTSKLIKNDYGKIKIQTIGNILVFD